MKETSPENEEKTRGLVNKNADINNRVQAGTGLNLWKLRYMR